VSGRTTRKVAEVDIRNLERFESSNESAGFILDPEHKHRHIFAGRRTGVVPLLASKISAQIESSVCASWSKV
jgi:hypothetical protein